VADLRAQRARDGGEELQPCRRSVQRERNGKLAIMERERERERERGGAASTWESHGEDDSMCLLIGQRVGWWAGCGLGFHYF
jgi:hypothetical protein